MSKDEDLLSGALTVFAREGYSRSSIAAIAAAAQVSTRTVYNRHESKAALFHAVITHSTRLIADHHIALVRRSTANRTLQSAVMELATNLACHDSRFRDHHSLIRQIQAERDRIPQITLDAWASLGPLRVHAVLEGELRRLFDDAGIELGDPAAAADTLLLLIDGHPVSRGFYREHALADRYLISRARRSAATFLAAYARPR